jgi:hypothetical protein
MKGRVSLIRKKWRVRVTRNEREDKLRKEMKGQS